MRGYTRLTKLAVEDLVVKNGLNGKIVGTTIIETSKDYVLSDSETDVLYVGIELKAASKVVTLGLDEGQILLLENTGSTNDFTIKNISTDDAETITKAKLYLVIGSATKNKTRVIALN